MTDGQGARGEPDEIEVFATGATVALVRESTAPAEQMERGRSAVREGLEHARDFRARTGYRPGAPIVCVSTRRGGPADIVRSVLVNPLLACEAALSGRLFREPLPGLHVDEQHDDTHAERYLVWNVSIELAHGRPVPASLHLLASPSMVVTVLEIVPQRRLRRRQHAFIRGGIDVIDALAERLCAVALGPDGDDQGAAVATPDARIA